MALIARIKFAGKTGWVEFTPKAQTLDEARAEIEEQVKSIVTTGYWVGARFYPPRAVACVDVIDTALRTKSNLAQPRLVKNRPEDHTYGPAATDA